MDTKLKHSKPEPLQAVKGGQSTNGKLRKEKISTSLGSLPELGEMDQAVQNLQHQKAMKMFEIHASQKFLSAKSIGYMRMKLLNWVIRTKIKENLKRIFDLGLCCLVFPLVAPILLVTAIAIKLDSPGPVLFRQPRVGKWGRLFTCYKFRSMYIDAEQRKAELMALNEADAVVFKIRNDPRITRVGRVIRKLSIDELPQLFNIIKGDMSLVGPRPLVPSEVDRQEFEHFRRLDAIPGLTGLQQISGRSELSFKSWVELDLRYIEEQSLLKDIEILLRTIPAVILGRGAY
jgi:lipopolysaccharide/colanic/teichoic acid biosynthesis glycosyltransferase